MRSRIATLVLLALVLPVATWFGLPLLPPLRTLVEPSAHLGSRFAHSSLAFERQELGPEPRNRPLISNVQILEFDGDGRNDVLACDVRQGCVVLCSRDDAGNWHESILVRNVDAPVHVSAVDLDADGDLDLMVCALGDILPNDGAVGQLLWFEQTSHGFTRHVVLEGVRRVADCQAADFDGDGDLDLAVAVFGYACGQILWLQNEGGGRFRDHELLFAPGTIHVPVADYDGDGDLDIAAVVSQEDEELWAFENAGAGNFRPRRLRYTVNFDLGSAGLIMDDLDQDGDPDLILPAGDNLEIAHSFPQGYHGCLWFENKGGWRFAERHIAEFGGTYAAAVSDLDGDGDKDVVLVSMINNWQSAANASVVWLENDGRQGFHAWQIDSQPTHRITVAVGDLDGDGRPDIVTGGMHLIAPFDRLGRLTAWMNRGRRQAAAAARPMELGAVLVRPIW